MALYCYTVSIIKDFIYDLKYTTKNTLIVRLIITGTGNTFLFFFANEKGRKIKKMRISKLIEN